MIAPTLSGEKNSAGEMVPAFICTKRCMAVRFPGMAPNSCCTSAGGGFIEASWQALSDSIVYGLLHARETA